MHTLEETRLFWPDTSLWDGFSVSDLLAEIQQFGLTTFDRLDVNGDGFISAAELERALQLNELNWREKNYVRFLLTNAETIGRAFDDNDGVSPCGISRHDLILGISRNDLIEYFSKL
ncbi:MAG: hypothetical protein KGS72_12195 [Cyanobacteria bacterium REEB67]|nr:hypothetical protein [Cyanobacteria bacterium REEB67]